MENEHDYIVMADRNLNLLLGLFQHFFIYTMFFKANTNDIQ